MKGPGLRNRLEVRRRWKCPQCNKEVCLPGDQTAAWCDCQKKEILMKLVEEYIPKSVQRFQYVAPKAENEPSEEATVNSESPSK